MTVKLKQFVKCVCYCLLYRSCHYGKWRWIQRDPDTSM